MAEREKKDVVTLIAATYRDVCEEFYAWDREYCTSVIQSLRQPTLVAPDLHDQHHGDLCTPYQFFANVSVDSKEIDWKYSEDEVDFGDDTETTEYKVAYLKAPALDPFPPYEACSPSTTSIFVGDDSAEMLFLPFPGTSFDLVGYLACFEDLAWQKRRSDPDEDVVILDTIRRLHNYHDISLEDIKRIVGPNLSMNDLLQRDLVNWLPFRINHNELPKPSPVPLHTDMKTRFQAVIDNFCPNLNCIDSFCALHGTAPNKDLPRSGSNSRPQKARGPCGTECYLSVSDIPPEQVYIDDGIRNTVTTLLSVCPDLTICELSVACWRSCREVYIICDTLESEDALQQDTDESKLEEETSAIIEKLDHFTLNYDPDLPCNHTGPCNSSSCSCYRNKGYCEKSCSCSPRCLRRFRGCKCCTRGRNRQKTKTCKPRLCPCYGSGRECDPEVCRCWRSDAGHFCLNSQIQRGESKRTVVKPGRYGMSLFVDQEVRRGELILEYTGELVFEDTVDCREYFTLYHGRNYFFKLTDSVTLDATRLGNESRFINHNRDRANCLAVYRLVNGVQRIGIYATKRLKPGDELHLDYGNEFFTDK